MPPLRNAVRFVDHESIDSGALIQPAQRPVEKIIEQQPLGSQVKKLELAAQQRRGTARHFRAIEAGVDETRRDIVVLQQAHLILHQRYQG